MCQLAIGHYLLNTNLTPVETWFTSEGFAEALVTLQQRYEFDGILINLLGTEPDWMRQVRRIETAHDGARQFIFEMATSHTVLPMTTRITSQPKGDAFRNSMKSIPTRSTTTIRMVSEG